jgi:sensor domain CHASE-containing protein
MNLPFFIFCIVAFVVTVIIDTYKKTHSQEKR